MTAILIEGVKPFKVRASCGHITVRKMREATAGVLFTEDTILEAPNGRACPDCEMLADAYCVRCSVAKAVKFIPAPNGSRISVCGTCATYYELGGRDAKEVMGMHPNGEVK